MSPSIELRENREFASEIKFLISPALAEQIRRWARARLAPDPNAAGEADGAYQITSLYFDTGQFDVFHGRDSFGRSKYRIRRYGQSEVAFLERKLKTRGLLAKRRSIIMLDELARLAEADPERGWAGGWFHRRLRARGLKPVCQISYSRTARVAMTQYGPIRLTLDQNLRARPADGMSFNGHGKGGQLWTELNPAWASECRILSPPLESGERQERRKLARTLAFPFLPPSVHSSVAGRESHFAVIIQSNESLTPSNGEREFSPAVLEGPLFSNYIPASANVLPLPLEKGEGRGKGLAPLNRNGLKTAREPVAVFQENQVILELKFRRCMPAIFRCLVEEFALNRRPFSKYRLAAAALELVPAQAATVAEDFASQRPSMAPAAAEVTRLTLQKNQSLLTSAATVSEEAPLYA